MGRWDTSLFGNDDAGDWAYELEEEGPEACLTRTLRELQELGEEEFLDVPGCEITVAAAAVAAMLRGMPRVPNLEPELSQLLDSASYHPSNDLLRGYLVLLAKVLTDGDVNEPGMWGEEADRLEWRGNVLEVKRFLEGEAAHG